MKEAMSNIPGYMMEAPKLLWDWWKKERRLRQKYDEGESKGAGTKSAQYHENFTTIYDNMWQYMPIYDNIRQDLTIWQYTTRFDNIGLYTATFDNILWQYVTIYDKIWQCMTIYDNIW